MKIKIAILMAATLAFAASTQAQGNILWQDDFESYANTAALSGPYTQIFPAAPAMLDTTKGYQSNQSVHFGTPGVNNERRMYINIPGGPVTPTDQAPLKLEFWTDLDTAIWSTRQYIEIRGYSGGEYGSGTLNQLIALGFTSSGVDTTRINQRVVAGYTGTQWGNLTDTYATRATIADPNNDWTKLAMVLYHNKVEFYVNDNLDTTQTMTAGVAFDSIVIGSGLSSAGADVWFDGIKLTQVPEPSSAVLALLGGLGVFAWISRRRQA
ncbi:MAG TPA: PEP-CTERM sorting domain-containing protein [Verrucomicrobiota bacterium]|jgi:hypothetical protein|nr:PEP-CTERM sorting domain-containing protein [Verrucomicrobiota bacterium]HNS70026.1 PEP-CTERM sorting domain-containing protein [Verrucomicrobiota bacterium]HRD04264.1 PEP-CTERM sorting domain-containing protein [Verrucomicrobiota bacterium]